MFEGQEQMETAEYAFRRAIEDDDEALALLTHKNLQAMRSSVLDALRASGGVLWGVAYTMELLGEVEVDLINNLRMMGEETDA